MTEEYLYILKALADNTRLEIITLLRKEKSLIVSDIIIKLKLEQTRLSHALKCLKNCGIVENKIKGKYRFYSLNTKFTNNLFKSLDEHLKIYREHIMSCNIVKNNNK